MSSLIRFAHRGAPVHPVAGNTLAAFEAALRHGAEGIESDVRLTADGVPVLVHGAGLVGRRPVQQIGRRDLLPAILTLAELWERCGNDFELSLDMSDPAAAEAVIDLARRHGALPRLWLTYWRLPAMIAWRRRWPEVRLVYATFFAFPEPVLRRTSARLAVAGINAINLHQRIIGRNSAATVHAGGLKLFAWGLRRHADIARLAALGADAVFVDEVSDEVSRSGGTF
jgi:glycerophosphoryl diester phosphodiesterase